MIETEDQVVEAVRRGHPSPIKAEGVDGVQSERSTGRAGPQCDPGGVSAWIEVTSGDARAMIEPSTGVG